MLMKGFLVHITTIHLVMMTSWKIAVNEDLYEEEMLSLANIFVLQMYRILPLITDSHTQFWISWAFVIDIHRGIVPLLVTVRWVSYGNCLPMFCDHYQNGNQAIYKNQHPAISWSSSLEPLKKYWLWKSFICSLE